MQQHFAALHLFTCFALCLTHYASALLQTARAKKEAPPESATDKVLAEEADMMRHITQKQALRAAKELATDTVYTRSMSTGWKPPAEARECGGCARCLQNSSSWSGHC
jgi:hypothetical protein